MSKRRGQSTPAFVAYKSGSLREIKGLSPRLCARKKIAMAVVANGRIHVYTISEYEPHADANVMNDVLAFFLTWTTYGSQLPGDERGWWKKPGEWMEPDPEREAHCEQLMTETELTLTNKQRAIVEKTIEDHCHIREWHLHIVKCLTQHVHVVVTANERPPKVVRDQLKAYCTRKLKEHQRATGVMTRVNWWTRGGSKRRLYTIESVEAAIRYVLEGQDGPKGVE